MIIRCQNGRLLNSDHVVEWDKQTEGEGNEEEHAAIAKTILDTSVEIFEGTQEECQIRLDEIDTSLTEERTMLRHLCHALAKRDDKLAAAIRRLIKTIN